MPNMQAKSKKVSPRDQARALVDSTAESRAPVEAGTDR